MNPKLKPLCRGAVTSALLVGTLILASPAGAHTGGPMMGQGIMMPAGATGTDAQSTNKDDSAAPAPPTYGPGMAGRYPMGPGMMGGYGMGPGMTGGYGMGPGMMGGYGMGPGMMGGYGMGPGMMGGYGMGPGMMGGYGMGSGMTGGYGMGPGMMGGYGMHPWMMGAYGMAPGMMGGYGMHPWMMGAYGMGPGMMGGYGMGPGMMGGYGVHRGMMNALGCGAALPLRMTYHHGWGHAALGVGRVSLAALGSPRAAAMLGLSKDQQQKITAILNAHEKSMTQAATRLRANMLALKKNLAQPAPDTKALEKTYRKLSDQRQKMLLGGIDARGRLLKVLNGEQRKRLEQMGYPGI